MTDICTFGIKQYKGISLRHFCIIKRECQNTKHFYPETLFVVVFQHRIGIFFTAGAEDEIKQRNVERK